MNLGNCPRCGKLYVKGIREVCNNCFQDLENEFQRCLAYLKENRGVTIQLLADATETSIKQITRWIREGRISLLNAPNLMYPCETCGTLIRDGSLCPDCKARLGKDMQNASRQISATAEEQRRRDAAAYQIFDQKDKK